MLLVIRSKASQKEIEDMCRDLSGYMKIVVDLRQEILAGGGLRHVEGEQAQKQFDSVVKKLLL